MQQIANLKRRCLRIATATILLTGVSTVGVSWHPLSPIRAAYARPFVNSKGQSIADITERAMPSVVSISTRVIRQSSMRSFGFGIPFAPREGTGVGSGVIVSSTGYVLTNNHVVEDAKNIKVTLHNGREISAKLVGADKRTDLAVLKLQGKYGSITALPFGNSSVLRLGEVVLAIGNPLGVGQSVSMGIVSAKGRGNLQLGFLSQGYQDFIQTDAAINPGNSGGALINMKGELIGINTAIASRTGGSQGIGFAIPSDMAQPIMESLIRTGKVSRGYMGVRGESLTYDIAQALNIKATDGAIISEVTPQSPAARAGFRRNDVVLALNTTPVKSWREFRNAVAAAGASARITIQVERKGKNIPIRVTLGDLDQDGKQAAALPKRRNRPSAVFNKTFGVRLSKITPRLRRRYAIANEVKRGVVVVDVEQNSFAAQLGIQVGDLILELNGREVRSPKTFKKIYKRSGRKLALLVRTPHGGTRYIAINK